MAHPARAKVGTQRQALHECFACCRPTRLRRATPVHQLQQSQPAATALLAQPRAHSCHWSEHTAGTCRSTQQDLTAGAGSSQLCAHHGSNTTPLTQEEWPWHTATTQRSAGTEQNRAGQAGRSQGARGQASSMRQNQASVQQLEAATGVRFHPKTHGHAPPSPACPSTTPTHSPTHPNPPIQLTHL